jgi:UDP-N-acetylglucosamine pyrophosphorylase
MNENTLIPASIRERMAHAGITETSILSFEDSYRRMRTEITAGGGNIAESSITPITELPHLNQLSCESDAGNQHHPAADLVAQLVVIKLNGGLGTGMGLDQAKSLLEVKDGLTFLDLIARQVLNLREKMHPGLRFLLMNSFSTRKDTLDFLSRYPELAGGQSLDFLQSKVPKLDAETMEPVSWPKDESLEWCPPGHGDIYQSLYGSGVLDELLEQGIRYAFISNSDNLGAYPDLRILDYMNRQSVPFLMEVTRRTEADRKGGHLAVRQSDGRLILREAAQCSSEDEDQFQDITRHQYFNTNNLWIRLDHLKTAMRANAGILSLPLITNRKTVDPTDSHSAQVLQLETAMGSAIEMFEGSQAIEVPRSRFAPVKKTDDLLALRSDAYEITDDFQVQLIQERNGVPPAIALDSKFYKLIADFDRLVPAVPSLKDCRKLEVKGEVKFSSGVRIEGSVTLFNLTGQCIAVEQESYSNDTFELH